MKKYNDIIFENEKRRHLYKTGSRRRVFTFLIALSLTALLVVLLIVSK